jgi:hypothetical protein
MHLIQKILSKDKMKNGLILFILILLSLSTVSALDIFNEEYIAGETLQAESNSSGLSTSQISLLNSDSQIVSISPLLTQIREDEHLIYFNLPTDLEVGQYKLRAGSDSVNFSIISGTQIIQFKPGVIILDDTGSNFKLEISNLFDDNTVEISSSSSSIIPRKSTLSFIGAENKNLFIDYTYTQIEKDETISLSYGSRSFLVPIIYPDLDNSEEINITLGNITEENITKEVNTTIFIEEEIIIDETEPLVFVVSSETVEVNIFEGESISDTLKIQNNLNETITELSIKLSGDLRNILSINEENIEIKSKELYSLNVNINQNNRAKVGEYMGEITLSNTEYSISLPMIITVSKEEIISEDSDANPGFIEVGSDNDENIEGENNATLFIGIILIFILGAIFIVVVLKLKQKDEKKFNQYINETKRKK